jgi:hypothetical protein
MYEMGTEARLGPAVGSPVLLEPIPLRNALGPGSLVLLSLILLGFGAWGMSAGGDWGMLTVILPGGLGLFTLAAGAVLFYLRARSRGSLALYEQGFVCESAGRRTAVRFDEVDSLALRQTSRTSYGTLVGMDRRATVRSPAGTLRFSQFSPTGKADSVAPVLNDLVGRLADVAEGRMRGGGSLDGPGWSLGPGGFSAKAGEIPVPATQLARAGLFEHKVSLWRDGDERPFFSVRDAAPNALVLGRLVQRLVRGKPETAAAGELGRVLFVRRSRKSAVYTVLGGLALLALGFFLGSRNVAGNDRLIALGMSVAGIVCLPASVLLWFKACRRHENGLSMTTLFGRREILYTDVERMSYSAVRHYHNGIYTGTQILLAAYPAAGKPIVFSAHSRGDSEDIDNLREDLARRIAGKLYARLAHQQEVPWTPRVRLSREGIRFEKQKFVGRGEAMFVPYAERPQIEIKAGTLHLSAPGRKGTLLRVPCMSQNFYPGFILFQALRHEAAGG